MENNTQKYRLKSGKHYRSEKQEDGSFRTIAFKPGSIFIPTDEELVAFRDKLELVGRQEPADSKEEAPAKAKHPPANKGASK